MKKKVTKETAKEKEQRIQNWRRLTYKMPTDDYKYCIENRITIYASAQKNNTIKLFVQHKEKFKPLNDKTYRQAEDVEILEYNVDIIKGYSEYAEIIKNKKKNGNSKS